MSIDVVVPVTRSAVLQSAIRCFASGTVKPDAITLVSNRSVPLDPCGLNVRWLQYSAPWPRGPGDQGLRRNVGIFASEHDSIVMFDDDQLPPATMLEHMAKRLEMSEFVVGHHRFIDFAAFTPDDLLHMDPEAGVSREKPANERHFWQSCYAGLLGASKELLWSLGGFDLLYRSGGEDQHLGYRVASKHYVHEPPFAWHGLGRLDADLLEPRQTCEDGAHTMARRAKWSVEYDECTTCTWARPRGAIVPHPPIIPYDHSLVRCRYEQAGA